MKKADERFEVAISNRNRVIFPNSGRTKGDLADYYARIAPLLLPFAASRPISLVRCPRGRARRCFYQKHDSGGFGDAVLTLPIRESDGEMADYLYVEKTEGLLQCVQMGTIEFHGWGSRSTDIEAPDRLIFDLDPDEGLDFSDVKLSAREVRSRLSECGLDSFAMLTGGKGVHVIVPLRPGHSWDANKDFARSMADAMASHAPERFTATMSKAKRKGKIFIDWLRNTRGATAILPYSARARPGAPVAAPISWDELAGFAEAGAFTIGDADQLIERSQGKDLAGWGTSDQRLPGG